MSMSRKGALRKSQKSQKAYGAIDSPGASGKDEPNNKPRTNDNLAKLQEDVRDVTGILKENVAKVVARGEKVDSLTDRTDNLVDVSTDFKRHATELKEATQRRNWRLICCIVCVVVVILVIVALVVLYVLKVI